MTLIRMDRKAAPQYRALPDDTRAAIEAAIPAGCYMTVLSAYWNGHDYHARIFSGTEQIAEVANVRYVEDACWLVIRRAQETLAFDPLDSPADDWFEGDDGYLRVRLVNGGVR